MLISVWIWTDMDRTVRAPKVYANKHKIAYKNIYIYVRLFVFIYLFTFSRENLQSTN